MEQKKNSSFSGRCQIASLNALYYTAGVCCSSNLIKKQGQKNTFSLRVLQSVKGFNFKLPRSGCPLKAPLPMYLCARWPLNSPHCFKYDPTSCVPLAQQSQRAPNHQVASSLAGCDATGQENHLAKGDQCWVTVRGLWLDVNWSGDSSYLINAFDSPNQQASARARSAPTTLAALFSCKYRQLSFHARSNRRLHGYLYTNTGAHAITLDSQSKGWLHVYIFIHFSIKKKILMWKMW